MFWLIISIQDLSSNELVHLPNSMGEMISLKDLNLRRNRLEVLPDGEITITGLFLFVFLLALIQNIVMKKLQF